MKCRFKNISPDEKALMQQTNCMLTISVGQEYHEGEKFEATIDLVNQSFSGCKIMLYDAVQRHSLSLTNSHDPDDFYQDAISLGDLWLGRNSATIHKLDNLIEIIRWDRWLHDPQYNNVKNAILKRIQQDTDYLATFDATITHYLERYTARLLPNQSFDHNRAYRLCFDYLIEECASLCLWHQENCHYDIYPATRNPAMAATAEHFVEGKQPFETKALSLKFKGKKQLKPQVLNLQEAVNYA